MVQLHGMAWIYRLVLSREIMAGRLAPLRGRHSKEGDVKNWKHTGGLYSWYSDILRWKWYAGTCISRRRRTWWRGMFLHHSNAAAL